MNTDDHNIITVQNIDDEEFTFYYDKSTGTPAFTILAGETKRFPKYIIKLGLKHLIDKILIKQDIKTNNKPAREELMKKIVVHEESFVQEPKESEAARIQVEIDRLNQPSELERILEKKRDKAAPLPEDKSVSTSQEMNTKKELPKEPAPVEEKFEELEQKDKAEPTKPKKVEAEPKKALPAEEDDTKMGVSLPSKKDLIQYATKELGMTVDKKLSKQFQGMTVTEMIKELQYPMERILK